MVKRYFPVLEYFNVPNAITLTGLVMGMMNIYLIMTGNFKTFYLLYFLVSCMDSLDGFAAKMLNQRTELGEELDSLCDGINFTLVPALFAIGMAGFTLPIIVGSAAFVVCGILRLGYYNMMSEEVGGFIGLPTTIASMFSLLFTWLFAYLLPDVSILVCVSMLLLSLLMISRIRLKGSNFFRILFAVIGLGFLVMGLIVQK